MAGHEDAGHPMVLDLDHNATLLKSTMPGAISPSEKTARSSFSSVRENDDGLAQTFTRSKISSYTNETEEVFDESPSSESGQPFFQPPLTNPHSQLNGFWAPAPTFRGWREIPLKGKKASRSLENLRSLVMSWSPPSTPSNEPEAKKKTARTTYEPGRAPIETLPSEVLDNIIDLLVVELPPNGLTVRNADLMALLLASRALHAATLTTLYRHITIPHSRIFRKFLNTVVEYPNLASIVRRLDFSHFNPNSIFSNASQRASTQNLTAKTLAQCLDLTPYLQEFLAQEYIDGDIDREVLRKLFFSLPRLKAVDFCGCSTASFREAFKELLEDEWPEKLGITRLSFHKCITLPTAVFETILPRLTKVTHLDLAGTRVTDAALMSIPTTAQITHLNLARCKELTSEAVVAFITTHPAVKDSLVFLSLATDASSHLLLGKDDIDKLVPALPSTLRSLSLKGSRMEESHISLLRPLTETLEELTLGQGLEISDIQKLFRVDGQWRPHSVRYLDISDIETRIGSASELLADESAPLHVIEVDERVYERAAKIKKTLQRVGWTAKEFGTRYWLVRLNADGSTADNGGRWWKMGAESWGMRKVPVAKGEVGGMYGSFMFGRHI